MLYQNIIIITFQIETCFTLPVLLSFAIPILFLSYDPEEISLAPVFVKVD